MIKVLGHRGCRRVLERYENTSPAFEYALKYSDGLEMDAVLSADKKLFCIHDVLYNGKTTRYMVEDHLSEDSQRIFKEQSKHLDEMTAEEIGVLKLKNGTNITPFSEFIDTIANYPNSQINIELKNDGTAPLVFEQCEQAIKKGKLKREKIIISSFNHSEILRFKQLAPDYRLSLLMTVPSGEKIPFYSWIPNSDAYVIPFSEAALNSHEMQVVEPWSINIEESDLTPEKVKLINAAFPNAKILIYWWGGNPEHLVEDNQALLDKLEALKQAGLLDSLYAIISDFPKEMKEVISNL